MKTFVLAIVLMPLVSITMSACATGRIEPVICLPTETIDECNAKTPQIICLPTETIDECIQKNALAESHLTESDRINQYKGKHRSFYNDIPEALLKILESAPDILNDLSNGPW